MRHILSLILILVFTVAGFTQNVTNRAGSWINLRLDMEWNDRIDADITQSNRFDNLVGMFAVSNTTLKVSYDINDWLKTTLGYRYMYRTAKDRSFNRYQLALQMATKLKDVKLSWRTRFEYREEINKNRQVSRLRNKLTARKKLKPIGLESRIFVEYWYTFDDPLRDFSKYRIGVSMTKEIWKQIDFRLGFNYDADINQDELERESIALLGLTYNFKRSKSNKKIEMP